MGSIDFGRECRRASVSIRPYLEGLTPLRKLDLKGDGLPGKSCVGPSWCWLKCENEQVTGSFKARGSYYKISRLLSEKTSLSSSISETSIKEFRAVTASSGNHGAGVAQAASRLKVLCDIYLGESVDPAKLTNMRKLGGEWCQLKILKGVTNCEEVETTARKAADEDESKVFVSPYNDTDVIVGQGTLAVEMFEQIRNDNGDGNESKGASPTSPKIDRVYVSVGGGGLIAGVGGYIKAVSPTTEVVACSCANSAYMHHWLTDTMESYVELETLSNGTAGGIEEGSVTFEICRRVVDRSLVVSEEEIAEAMRLCHDRCDGMRIEGAAGVAVAGWLKDRYHEAELNGEIVAFFPEHYAKIRQSQQRVEELGEELTSVVVVCGGNIDEETFRRVIKG